MNYYQRHLGDYARDTGWLSTYQHGVFALLLDWYYANEKPIPVDLAYRIVKARSGPERKATQEVLLAFFDLNKCAGFAHNKHADLVIAKYQFKSTANSLIAKEAWDAKRMRFASETQCDVDATQEPVTNSQQKQEQSAPRQRKSRQEQTLPEWTAALDGADAIPADDPLFAWAAKVGIPHEWLALAWWVFEARYADNPKRYADWRAVFRKAVREDWLKLWRTDQRAGGFVLTAAGEMAQREMAP